MDKERAILFPESCFCNLRKGSKEYLKEKAFCKQIEEEFNKSLNRDVKIPAKIREKLVQYRIISIEPIDIEAKIHEYVVDENWERGWERILDPVGKAAREIVRQRGDIPLVDTLSDKEKEIIREFRTPEERKATMAELTELSRKIEGLFLDKQGDKRTSKGEAALWLYYATRHPEELGKKFVKQPEYYRERIQFFEDFLKQKISDVYNTVPKTKYWWLVWNSLDWCYCAGFPTEKILKEKQLLMQLNFPSSVDSVLSFGQGGNSAAYLRLRNQIIKEADGRRIDGKIDGIETIEDVVRQIESAYQSSVIDSRRKIIDKLITHTTFLIAFFLRNKHRQIYGYYKDQVKEILNKLKKIVSGHWTEEFEYLNLKAILDGDLLFACIFHDYLRGGERYLKKSRRRGRPVGEFKEILGPVKPWIVRLKDFKIKNYRGKGMLILNALANREIYSTQPDIDIDLAWDQGRNTGLKSKGEKLLAKELRRLKKTF